MLSDVLSDVLVSMRLTSTVYFCDQLSSPWDKAFNDPKAASFHQIRRGGCWLQVDDITEYLGPGDLVFVGAGVPHRLVSHKANDISEKDTPPTLLLCGYCEFSLEADSPMQALFPKVSILRQAEIEQNPWVRASLDRIAAEYLSARPGALVVVQKLTEVLVVELIRDNFGREEAHGYLHALSDKQLGRALQRMHADPAKSWTLAILADDIGMSRATLARRFKELVGQTMFDYLTRLRIQRAKTLLEEVAKPLYDIASDVGYESEVAFTKTFKRQVGMTPTGYRRALNS